VRGLRADLRDLEGSCVRFARLLRGRGLGVAPEQTARWLRSVRLLESRRPQDLYWSGRVNLLSSPGQLDTYDALFRAFWITLEHPAFDTLDALEALGTSASLRKRASFVDRDPGDAGASMREAHEMAGPGRGLPGMEAWARMQPAAEGGVAEKARDESKGEATRGVYSPCEILREKDFAAFTLADTAALRALLEGETWWTPRLISRRARPFTRGPRLDLRATLASVAHTGGEPVVLHRLRRRMSWHKWIFLCDISASMSAYSEGLLHCLQTVVVRRPRTEVFLFGTRLTRATPQLRRCRASATDAYLAGVRDWHGGTRLGESLEAFMRKYGDRGMGHGAIMFVLSDGLDQGEAGLVERVMRRLDRIARRIVWINPLKKSQGYQPLARGMAEALPFIDDFVSGHSFATLSEALMRASC